MLTIVVDTRESITIFNQIALEFPQINFTRKKLDAGDYYAYSETDHGLVVFERKTISDFYSSIIAKKQANGCSRMANEVDKLAVHENEIVLFAIIGSVVEYCRLQEVLGNSMSPDLIFDEIASFMTRENFHVFWTYSEYDSRIMMVKFIDAVHRGKYKVPARRDVDKLMARILKISLKQYLELKLRFGSITSIASQPVESLTKINGIGTLRANFILEILNTVQKRMKM